jgi:hypothetical protein
LATCCLEMDEYDLSIWKAWIFEDVHYSYEFLYYWLENINWVGNWNGIPMILDMFMISCVPNGTEEVVEWRQQLRVAEHTQA